MNKLEAWFWVVLILAVLLWIPTLFYRWLLLLLAVLPLIGLVLVFL
jgi:hypothetical protein